MVFLHGWPDTAALWDEQVAKFKDTHRCCVLTLPHYASAKLPLEKRKRIASQWGPNFDKLAILLADEVKKLQKDESDKAILVIHDWGAQIGFTCQANWPQLFQAVIAFDVGPTPMDGARWIDLPKVLLVGLVYQYWLATAYLISRVVPFVGYEVGEMMTRAAARVFKGRLKRPQLEDVTVNQNYMYWNFHVNFYKEMFGLGNRTVFYLKDDKEEPDCPILFFYGSRKPAMFHSLAWEKTLRRSDKCEVVPVSNRFHWLMDGNSDFINGKMEAFLSSKL